MTTRATQPPRPVDWRELIAAGRAALIAEAPATQPAPAAIRRAISTAYYAAFHALTTSNAEMLMGTVSDQLPVEAWIRIYRGLDHRQARTQLQQNRAALSVGARAFAELFYDLQIERHNADYNPLATFTAQTATNWLTKAEATIIDFLETSATERAAIAILTLIRPR